MTEKWVLSTSTGPITQYFVGSFDGIKFTNDNPANTTLWIDYGPDSYAGVTWNSAPNNRTVFISWMNNWQYADKVPTELWRGQTSIPRSLSLIYNSDKKLLLSSMPVPEINGISIRSIPVVHNTTEAIIINANTKHPINNNSVKIQSKLLDINLNLDISGIDSQDVFGLHFGKDKLSVYYNNADKKYYINRANAGKHDFSDKFQLVTSAPRLTSTKSMNLSLIVDVSSIELFADNGLTVMTSLFFPNESFNSEIELFLDSKSKTSQIKVTSLFVQELKSIW
jgi:fructan beta-fructosidase